MAAVAAGDAAGEQGHGGDGHVARAKEAPCKRGNRPSQGQSDPYYCGGRSIALVAVAVPSGNWFEGWPLRWCSW